VHNSFEKGDLVEVVTPNEIYKNKIIRIQVEPGDDLESAHGGQDKIFKIKFDKKSKEFLF